MKTEFIIAEVPNEDIQKRQDDLSCLFNKDQEASLSQLSKKFKEDCAIAKQANHFARLFAYLKPGTEDDRRLLKISVR